MSEGLTEVSRRAAAVSQRPCRLDDAAAQTSPLLPCPMCDKPDAEALSETPTTILYLCLICGYRFAMARPRRG